MNDPERVPSERPAKADASLCIEMLHRMLLIRAFDTELERLHLRGEMVGSLHSFVGQEATAVGACAALQPDDYVTGHHRSHGHPIAKGAALPALAAELFGRRAGVCKGLGGSMHLADFSVGSIGESGIVGSSIPIATGAGLASQVLDTGRVCLSFFGDGATTCGVFHESLNVAAVWKLPVVYLCENNLVAAFSRFEKISAVADVAERARAHGIPGVVVDGQDAIAVHEVVTEAVARARDGHGPTLVEAKTYRYADHSVGVKVRGLDLSDDRPPGELSAWQARDPIELLRQHIVSEGIATEDELAWVQDVAVAEVGEAVEFARQAPPTEPADAVDSMYVDPTGMFALGGGIK